MNCRDARPSDVDAITGIYNHYVINEVATFEESPVTNKQMQQRIEQVQVSGLPWLVAEREEQILGYAYADNWKSRSAYRHSKEVTVYISDIHRGEGVGSVLYQALFQRLKNLPIHALIGGITLPHPASVALHEKFGMHKVAHFERVGYKFNQWLDVGYWQINLRPAKDVAGSTVEADV